MLTPQGRGAVATLLVEGPRAAELVGELFHPASGRAIREQPSGRIAFGRWLSAQDGEELIVCRRDSERFEIHCHGGQAASGAIIATLVERGCTAIAWQDWLRASSPEPIAAEAQIALAATTTERTAAILCDQLAGALRRAIDELATMIRDDSKAAALTHIDHLLEYQALGCHLVQPWQVALAGRTNVGKSSLINALLGFQRTIVHATAGTTRDVVTAAAAIDGWPVELADTAGLRASSDALEVAGIGLGERQLSKADLVVLVFDSSAPWSAEDEAMAATWPNALRVFNKCDLASSEGTDRTSGVRTCALTGEGLAELERAISKRLVPSVPPPGQAVPFTVRQVETLRQIKQCLQSGQPAMAGQLLARASSWADVDC